MKKCAYILILASLFLFQHGCGETESFIYDGPLFISFINGTSGKYYVDDDNNIYNILVGIPQVQSADVTARLEILHSTGSNGIHYYVPSEVTIPAGDLSAEFAVHGVYDQLAGREDTLIIGLAGDIVSYFDSSYTIYMEQLDCTYRIEELAGTWTTYEISIENGQYVPYELTVAANPNGGDTIVVTDYWDYLQGYDAPFKIVFDVSDTNNITCFVPPQYQFTHDDLGDLQVESLQNGTYSKCYNVISDLILRISVPAGIVDETIIIMEQQ